MGMFFVISVNIIAECHVKCFCLGSAKRTRNDRDLLLLWSAIWHRSNACGFGCTCVVVYGLAKHLLLQWRCWLGLVDPVLLLRLVLALRLPRPNLSWGEEFHWIVAQHRRRSWIESESTALDFSYQLFIIVQLFVAGQDAMESTLHFPAGYRIDHRSFSPQLGFLDYFDWNPVVHEERPAFQHQTKCALVGSSLFLHDVHEFDFESTGWLDEQQENPQSWVLSQAFQHNRIVGTDDRSHLPGIRHITRAEHFGCRTCDNRCGNQRCNLLGLPN